jgi:hypothetical protein
MAFKGAMSGYKPKFDDEEAKAGTSEEGDDETAEGEEDTDESLGETAWKAGQAGDFATFAEMCRKICAKTM